MNEHVGEDAALYALGALDEAERAAIDAHAARCEACARLLGEAEDDVAAMVDAQELHELPARPPRRSAWRAAVAIAAVFLIGFFPSLYLWQQNRAMHESMLADSAAMNRLASAPFRTAAFATMPGSSSARVMYAPDGSWYVVVVRGASRALRVAWMHDGKQDVLGTAEPHGDVAMLYLPRSHRMDQLALMDGQAVVAEAQLAF